MPCERKHIEAIREALGRCDKYMPFGCGPEVRPFVDVYSAVADALEACDQSPCEWTVGPFSRDYVPGCSPETSTAGGGWRYAWSAGFVKSMTYCPHCGRKIAPLPEAPRKDET